MSLGMLPKKQQAFRKDINGLRAWAVLTVVLYHFSVFGFRGGFIGVDVFFVISGFLMTGIIYRALSAPGGSQFSFINFYLARARRIIPALLAVCIALLIAGWFYLPAVDYGVLGKHVASALGFYSNFQFLSEARYFDAESYDKWLLHTWSLSVEWQFYILLPLFMAVLWKLRPSKAVMTFGLATLFVMSLCISVIFSISYPSAAFYLLPTRGWEMAAGGLVYLTAEKCDLPQRMRQCIELIGFSLIVVSVAMLDVTDVWPGSLALIPVLGTMMVLIASRERSILTSTAIAQWLGSRSYSIYLWHWPIVVALVYTEYQSSAVAIGLGLLGTFVLGSLSYSMIEKSKLFLFSRFSSLVTLIVFVILSAVFAGVGLFVSFVGANVEGRIPPRANAAFEQANNVDARHELCKHFDHSKIYDAASITGCTFGGEHLAAITIGDSHAGALVKAVEFALPSKNDHVLQWTLDACPTVLSSKTTDGLDECGKFVAWALEQQKVLPKNVPLIIVNRTSLYAFGPNESDDILKRLLAPMYFESPDSHGLPEHLEKMRAGIIDTACAFKADREVYLVRPIPEQRINVPKFTGRALLFGVERDISVSMEEYKKRNAFVWEAQDAAVAACGVKVLDPLPFLCEERACHGSNGGLPIYYDDDHLNLRGAALLAPMFSTVFKNKE
ncbi:acyltransferase [Pseudomonas sp. VS40]|uniref:acyltransferase family protein n=1 Tax=unclassified Pseudomonas TaxID=196821 RepID=UPI001BDE6205|nr:acyltransferase [Pseudomonas sp. VS40]MBT1272263.1 acyltransferase [Pseudomonas sp. VS59]